MSEENGTVRLGEDTLTEGPGPIVDKAALLAGKAFELTAVPIPGLGVIMIRPLSRAEALAVYQKDMPAAKMEQVLISKACVNPTFTPAEVGQWQASSAAGEMLILVNAILEVSGMEIGSGKAAYKTFRGAS
ncbi:MAG TPA: hypothetical protein VIU11_14465 [Nakamurella sp.]